MAISLKQAVAVGSYVVRQRLAGRKRYPLVLMLEPLFRCNLACGGCGKIQHPVEVLRRHLTPEQCFAAVEECGAPVVSIPGGEPLLHPQIDEIVRGLIDAQEVRVPVHQRDSPRGEPRQVHAVAVLLVQRPPRRPARRARSRGRARRHLRRRRQGDQSRQGARLSRHDEHDDLRRRRSGDVPGSSSTSSPTSSRSTG